MNQQELAIAIFLALWFLACLLLSVGTNFGIGFGVGIFHLLMFFVKQKGGE